MPQLQLETEIRKKLLKRGVLPLLEKGAHLKSVLERLVQNVEAQADEMLAAIFFYDPASVELSVGAAPHLQPSYIRAVNGFKVAPTQPSCGSAVFKRERVISPDVKKDPLWEKYLQFAEGAGIRAIWSEPIFNETKEVLGTVAFYFPEPKSPDQSDLIVLEATAELAAFAIQNRRDQFVSMYELRKTQI